MNRKTGTIPAPGTSVDAINELVYESNGERKLNYELEIAEYDPTKSNVTLTLINGDNKLSVPFVSMDTPDYLDMNQANWDDIAKSILKGFIGLELKQ